MMYISYITLHELVVTPSLSYLGHPITNTATYIISAERMTYSVTLNYVCRVFARRTYVIICRKGRKGFHIKTQCYILGSNFHIYFRYLNKVCKSLFPRYKQSKFSVLCK